MYVRFINTHDLMSNRSMVGKHDESDDSIITPVVSLHKKCGARICTKQNKKRENTGYKRVNPMKETIFLLLYTGIRFSTIFLKSPEVSLPILVLLYLYTK